MWWEGLATDRMFLYCSDTSARWKSDRPMSRQEFEARFRGDAACARYLVERRWPDGFVCPVCGGRKGWKLNHARPAWECADCRRQTSMTAGTVMPRRHLPLKTWFLAAHIVASHSNGISALQLQAQLGLGSYKTAWLLLHKLRRAMVDPDRSLLQTLVETCETEMPFRSKHDPVDRKKGGRSPVAKIFIVGAVELSADGLPRRIRMAQIPDGSSKTLHGFIAQAAAPGARVITDGWLGYENPPVNPHEGRVVEGRKAHELLPWVHPRLLEPQAMGQGRLPRPAQGPCPALSRRVHVSLEPTTPPAQRFRHAPEDRHRPRASELPEISQVSASDTGRARINGTASCLATDNPHKPSTRSQCLIGGMSAQDVVAPESKG